MTDLRRIFALYDRAYRLLDDVTPRRFNCGTLCGAACCHNLSKSGDTETGMLLLPFEKDYLQHAGAAGYSYLCDSNREEPDMLICSGLCDRRFRPFACRIFPCYASFFEVKNGKTALHVRPDPRAGANMSACYEPRFSPFCAAVYPQCKKSRSRSFCRTGNLCRFAKDFGFFERHV